MRRLFHERTSQKLSVPALETLAVIAYRQPVTAPEIAEIRGVNTSGVLNTLIGRKLVKVVGRKPVVGRPFMYGTTRDFLDKFGLNDLSDLPKVEDLADVLGFDPPALAELDAHRAAAGVRLRRRRPKGGRRRAVAAMRHRAATAGATQALPLARVDERQDAGDHVGDRQARGVEVHGVRRPSPAATWRGCDRSRRARRARSRPRRR